MHLDVLILLGLYILIAFEYYNKTLPHLRRHESIHSCRIPRSLLAIVFLLWPLIFLNGIATLMQGGKK